MGLGAPKKRSKISNDPNNLAWATATNTFGHKILTANGWQPGEFLGARDAPHADHYTAANASSIRVTLREDGLGLGAQIGKGNAETFGLSMFSGLLGRLNGKSETELQAQHKAQRDVELRMYQSQKHGTMNFLYGGLLVGDKIEDRKLEERFPKIITKTTSTEIPEKEPVVTESRKRKIDPDTTEDRDAMAKKKQKKEKKEKRRQAKAEQPEEHDEAETKRKIRRRRTSAIVSSSEKSNAMDAPSGSDSSPDISSGTNASTKARKREGGKGEKGKEGVNLGDEKTRRKLEKRARKEERRKRKEEKRKKKAEKYTIADLTPAQSSTKTIGHESLPAAPAQATSAVATSNRHAVRHRYIQQKRMASINPQALKEIFMLTAAS